MNRWTNLQGIYVGGRHDLKGQTALLMDNGDGTIKAQFNNIKLAKNLSHAWPKFKKSDFRLHVEVIEPKREKRRNEEMALRIAATKAALTNGRFLG